MTSDAVWGHAVQPAHVVLAVPHAQPLAHPEVAAHPEVDVFPMLEGRQVPLAFLGGVPHVPGAQRSSPRQATPTPRWQTSLPVRSQYKPQNWIGSRPQ